MIDAASSTSADAGGVDDIAVVADGLNVRYGQVNVLSDVSFALPGGAVLGLVGRNGAGKTSLLRCLLGLTLPSRGVARLFGCDSATLSDAVRERLGYVAQTPELFDWLRVREQLQLVGELYPGWTPARSSALCERLELNPAARIRNLSGGEKQRLAIILAMQHRPDLLVVDEPVASLDPISRRDFLRLLFEQDSDRSVAPTSIISSHLLDDLERIATHLLFLAEGKVQLFGTRDEIAERVVEVNSLEPLPSRAGLLRSKTTHGRWRSVVDTRAMPIEEVSRCGELRALALGELFVALNE